MVPKVAIFEKPEKERGAQTQAEMLGCKWLRKNGGRYAFLSRTLMDAMGGGASVD